MRLLFVAATSFEVEPFLNFLKMNYSVIGDELYKKDEVEVNVCITGIGMMMTTYSVLESIREFKPDFALQAGVAGSFDKQLQLGDLVLINSEQIADLGAEDHDDFLDIFLSPLFAVFV